MRTCVDKGPRARGTLLRRGRVEALKPAADRETRQVALHRPGCRPQCRPGSDPVSMPRCPKHALPLARPHPQVGWTTSARVEVYRSNFWLWAATAAKLDVSGRSFGAGPGPMGPLRSRWFPITPSVRPTSRPSARQSYPWSHLSALAGHAVHSFHAKRSAAWPDVADLLPALRRSQCRSMLPG
eukprot:scaffold4444_cov32-Phaeocystis_antarctica.AAC.2